MKIAELYPATSASEKYFRKTNKKSGNIGFGTPHAELIAGGSSNNACTTNLQSPDAVIAKNNKNNLIIKTPITGHIDILQIRNGLIHILDYKPEADKISPIEQLIVYTLALASRTKLAVKDFKAAWFDENNYFEFFPLHAVCQEPPVKDRWHEAKASSST